MSAVKHRDRFAWLATAIRQCAAVVVHVGLVTVAMFPGPLRAEVPSPVLSNVYPAGGQAGTTLSVVVEGSQLEGLTALRFADPRISARKKEGNQFELTIPPDIRPGVYDARVVATGGVSGPRAFFIG